MLKGLGIDLIPASAPDFFPEDTPTAVLVRQVLGAIAQFEKASLVAKLKAAGIASGLGMANARAAGPPGDEPGARRLGQAAAPAKSQDRRAKIASLIAAELPGLGM